MIADRARRFEELLGSGSVRVVESSDPLLLHQPVPAVVVTPESMEALQETVKLAFSNGIPLVPVGGNTEPRWPSPGSPDAVLLSTRGLSGAIEHESEDLVVTVSAGTTLEKLQQAVAPSGQRLALSPPYSDRATVGGIVARGAEGPTLHRFGPVRDQILGIRVVHGDGRATRAGGRVVKNVTGYDLMRLYTGSRGTLGIITELTFRLRPVAECQRVLVLPLPDGDRAHAAGWRLRQEVPECFGLHVLAGQRLADVPAAEGHAALVVSLAGVPALVDALDDRCRKLVPESGSVAALDGDEASDLSTPFPHEWIRARVSRLPAAWRGDLQRMAGRLARFLADPATRNEGPGHQIGVQLDVQTGRLDVGLARSDSSRPEEMGYHASDFGDLDGFLQVPSDPGFHLRSGNGRAESALPGERLMRRLMLELDPGGILNPGRFEVAR